MIYDLGSGLMNDLSDFGVDEPTVQSALRDGADVVLSAEISFWEALREALS